MGSYMLHSNEEENFCLFSPVRRDGSSQNLSLLFPENTLFQLMQWQSPIEIKFCLNLQVLCNPLSKMSNASQPPVTRVIKSNVTKCLEVYWLLGIMRIWRRLMLVSSETKLILMASTLPKCIKSPFAASNHLSFVSLGDFEIAWRIFLVSGFLCPSWEIWAENIY